ncbi:MAG TPA: hypothetical protein PLZ55_17070, partial [bacterium]|nr:hypothetical protein [bacterium]
MTRYLLTVAAVFCGFCTAAEQAIPKDEQAVQEVLAVVRLPARTSCTACSYRQHSLWSVYR